ncbi:efflux RND transporter periplasmic adaptor subunit [Emcibacter sp.]|uniref:efflux RND transporter periplasmic adaptor subunit n=1 Tax=Emcibacter sp. TaxID=1979954 RepID=UPI002AA6E656|nr:efflux RND transporter periplasmic adaptor subunit [Emcibacter sp.]
MTLSAILGTGLRKTTRMKGQLGLYFLLALPLAGAITAQAQDMPKARVVVGEVVNTEMSPTLTVPGSVISMHDSRLAAETSATVDWVAEVGTQVEKGEPVARLNPRLLSLDLANREAEIKSTEAQIEFRRKEVARLEELLKKSTISEARYDEAYSTLAVLKQQLEQAKAERDRTEYLLEKSVIRAPVPGWVVERFISVGEYVSAGSEVVRLVDTKETEISAQAPLSLVDGLNAGMKITVTNGVNSITTPVRAIIPVGDNVSRMVEIRLEIPENLWIIGSAVRVNLPKDLPRKVTAIPRDALIIRAGRNFVFRVNDEGKSENVAVSTGAIADNLIEVEGSLKAGDRVIVRGGETLKAGQDVEIISGSDLS